MNDKNFCSINCSKDDNLDKLGQLLNNQIQKFQFIDEEGIPIYKEDEKVFLIERNY